MKLISVNCTIEVSKDTNGYSNNYYVDIDENGVSVSHPYVKQVPEQITFVNNIINTFIANAINCKSRINAFNKEMGLEEYAAVTPPQVETTGSDFDLDAKSAVAQSPRGGSVQAAVAKQIGRDYEEALEERETGSDKA